MIHSIKSILQIKEYPTSKISKLVWVSSLSLACFSNCWKSISCVKPNCLSYRISLAFKNVIKRLCMSLSIIWLILESNEIGRQLLQLMWSSFLKIGITFAVFKLPGKIPVENGKLAISDIVLLRGVWNSFRNLIEILEGPEDLSFFRFCISDRTSSLLVEVIKKELLFGLFKMQCNGRRKQTLLKVF